jgi:hypothetical protein
VARPLKPAIRCGRRATIQPSPYNTPSRSICAGDHSTRGVCLHRFANSAYARHRGAGDQHKQRKGTGHCRGASAVASRILPAGPAAGYQTHVSRGCSPVTSGIANFGRPTAKGPGSLKSVAIAGVTPTTGKPTSQSRTRKLNRTLIMTRALPRSAQSVHL